MMKHILGLLTSAESYVYFLKRGWTETLLVYLGFILVAGLLFGGRLQQRTVPKFVEGMSTLTEQLVQEVPNDIEITFQDNQVTVTSQTQPIELAYPPIVKEQLDNYQLALPAMLARYSEETLSIETLEAEYSSYLFVLEPTSLHIKDTPGQWTSYPLAEVLNEIDGFSVNYEQLQNQQILASQILKDAWRETWFVPLLIAPILLLVGTSLKLVVEGLLLVLLTKLNNINLNLGQVAKLSLLFGSVAVLVAQIGVTLYPGQSFPFFSVTFWSLAIYILVFRATTIRKHS